VEPVLDLVPQGGAGEGFFRSVIEFAAFSHAGDAQTVNHIVIDGLGEGIVFLEHHAHAAAEFLEVEILAVDVDAMDVNGTRGDARVGDAVVDAVDAADQGGLATAGGADESGDLAVWNIESDIVQDLLRAIGEVDIPELDRGARAGGNFWWGIYHLSLLRILARRTMEPNESTATRMRNTSTEPYWARWVYSEFGMRAARV